MSAYDALAGSYDALMADGAHRRRDLVEVTPAGRAAVEQWRLRAREAEETMLRGFSEEERARFADYLIRAHRNLREKGGGGQWES